MDPFVAIVIGFVMLIVGGELLVRGSVRVAETMGVSPLFIGIVLVGFGTSAPEMATSIHAAKAGSPGIAVGNFVGSSISNICLILGISALMMPNAVSSRALVRDGTMVVVTAVTFAIISVFLPLNPQVGFVLLLWLVAYLFYAWRQERVVQGSDPTSAVQKAEAHGQLRNLPTGSSTVARIRSAIPPLLSILLAIVGLGVLIYGGGVLVDGAVELARRLGVSEAVIGLTIVAVGTSMPELVTSIVAALRGHQAMALGNILGSNIYNILGVGGLTAVVAPTVVPERISSFDNLVMVAAAVLLMVFARSGFRINRFEGLILFSCYVAYIYSLLPGNALMALGQG